MDANAAKKVNSKPMTFSEAHAELSDVRAKMNEHYVERETEVEYMLMCLVAKLDGFFGGPPGTAKTSMIRAMCDALGGLKFFMRQLTPTMTPEELFGPWSLTGMAKDQFHRILENTMADADVVYFDETWRGSDAIGDNLLLAMSDRIYLNGTKKNPVKLPMRTVFGSSNSVPDEAYREALYDRFLVRRWVNYVRDRGNRKTMYTQGDPRELVARSGVTLSAEALDVLYGAAQVATISDGVEDSLLDIQIKLEAEGITASDRRWFQIRSVLRAYAVMQGQTMVDEDCFEVLPDCLWKDPKERPRIAQIVGQTASPELVKARELLDIAKTRYDSLPRNNELGKAKTLAALGTANDELDGTVEALRSLKDAAPEHRKNKIQKVLDQVEKMYADVRKWSYTVSMARGQSGVTF